MIFSKCSTKLCPVDNIVLEHNHTCQQSFLSPVFSSICSRRLQWKGGYSDEREGSNWRESYHLEDDATSIWQKAASWLLKINCTLCRSNLIFFWYRHWGRGYFLTLQQTLKDWTRHNLEFCNSRKNVFFFKRSTIHNGSLTALWLVSTGSAQSEPKKLLNDDDLSETA